MRRVTRAPGIAFGGEVGEMGGTQVRVGGLEAEGSKGNDPKGLPASTWEETLRVIELTLDGVTGPHARRHRWEGRAVPPDGKPAADRSAS